MSEEMKPTPRNKLNDSCPFCQSLTCCNVLVNQSEHVKGLVEALEKIAYGEPHGDNTDILPLIADEALKDYRRATEGKHE